MEGMNSFRIRYIYTWNCHNETPYFHMLNKQKCLFSKTKDRKVKQVLSEGWHQWEGEDIRKGLRLRRVNMMEIHIHV
jgi:hypothetical protein